MEIFEERKGVLAFKMVCEEKAPMTGCCFLFCFDFFFCVFVFCFVGSVRFVSEENGFDNSSQPDWEETGRSEA